MLSIGGVALVLLGKWLGEKIQDYQDPMARVHRIIATVLKAEKGERETRRKSLAIVHGFDNTKCMKTNLEIKD